MATMDLSMRRNDRGISVFWMILSLAIGTALVLALALALTEGTPSEAASDPDSNEVPVDPTGAGTAPEGVADITPAEMATDPAADSLLVNGSGAGASGLTEGAAVADQQTAPERGVEGATGATPADDAVARDATPNAVVEGTSSFTEDAPGELATDPVDGTTERVVDPDGEGVGGEEGIFPTPSGPEGGDDDPLTAD